MNYTKKSKQKTTAWKGKVSVFSISVWIFMIVWVAIFLTMLGWGILTSVKDINYYWFDPVGFPKQKAQWAFSNYTIAFKSMKIKTSNGWVFFPGMLKNTLFYVIVFGLLHIISPMLCSYVYAKYSKRIKWTKLLWLIVLINLYVPLSASLGASLDFAMKLGIYDNIYAYTICALNGFGPNFLIYYATWKGVSWEYAEAAFMDGASDFSVMLKIMFPMTATVFGVLFITQVIALWSDYQSPMLYLPSFPTLAYGVYTFQSNVESGASAVPIKIASLIAVAVPMMLIFIAFKDKMMGSLTLGGLKG